jgi:hypothetical protein
MAGMPKESFIKLLPSVQLGLTELHKQFALKECYLTLALQDGIRDYSLTKAFAVSNTRSSEPVKYLLDSASPFQDDLLKVQKIFGTYQDETYEIPLNTADNSRSIRTPAYNKLRLPTDTETAPWLLESPTLEIVYRADHPALDVNVARVAPSVIDIDIPSSHTEALCLYIASRVYNPIGMTPGAMHEGNNFYTKFMASVQQLKADGYEVDNDAENLKAYDRGFC